MEAYCCNDGTALNVNRPVTYITKLYKLFDNLIKIWFIDNDEYHLTSFDYFRKLSDSCNLCWVYSNRLSIQIKSL